MRIKAAIILLTLLCVSLVASCADQVSVEMEMPVTEFRYDRDCMIYIIKNTGRKDIMLELSHGRLEVKNGDTWENVAYTNPISDCLLRSGVSSGSSKQRGINFSDWDDGLSPGTYRVVETFYVSGIFADDDKPAGVVYGEFVITE